MCIISVVDSNIMDFVFTSFVHRFNRKGDEDIRPQPLQLFADVTGLQVEVVNGHFDCRAPELIDFIKFFFAPFSIRRLASTTLDEVQFYLICRIL